MKLHTPFEVCAGHFLLNIKIVGIVSGICLANERVLGIVLVGGVKNIAGKEERHLSPDVKIAPVFALDPETIDSGIIMWSWPHGANVGADARQQLDTISPVKTTLRRHFKVRGIEIQEIQQRKLGTPILVRVVRLVVVEGILRIGIGTDQDQQ